MELLWAWWYFWALRARAGALIRYGRGAHGEVVVMVAHTVDLGMELEKWI